MRLDSNNFYEKFAEVGSNLLTDEAYKEYVDLEMLFIEMTQNLVNDDRTYRAIIYWVHRYGGYLSPRKIISLVNKYEVSRQRLNILLSYADKNYPKGKFEKVYEDRNDFGYNPFEGVGESVKCSDVAKMFRIKLPYVDLLDKNEMAHSLKSYKWCIRNLPEIRYRAMGLTISIADTMSAKEKDASMTLYAIAQKTNTSYSIIHKAYKMHVCHFVEN